MNGWNGQSLSIDLSKKSFIKKDIPQKWLEDFIGGRGLNSRTLFDLVKPPIDPLGSENVLILGVGPVTGTLTPSSSRSTFTTLSPLIVVGNGKRPGFGDSNAGGDLGTQLKYAGYDQVILTKKAEKPIYIVIENEQISFKDASHLWGKNTLETQKIIKEELGDDNFQIACIGPAGENLVRYASIFNWERAWAKCGVGAVMGSKNLKAIAIRGTGSVKVKEPEKLSEIALKAIDVIYSDPSCVAYSELGTSVLVEAHQINGRLCFRNFQGSQYDDWEKINSESFSRYWKGSKACGCCPLHCGHYFSIDAGVNEGLTGEMPEYVTIASFGSKLDNNDPETILIANKLCNELGMDTLVAGSTIAWAMECWQKGVINEKDTDGLLLEWGNKEVILELIKKIAYREGAFGDLLAEGNYKAAKKIGKGSEDWVIHVKGQDPALSDPRSAKAWGLGYAVSSRGGDHLRALPSLETYFTPEEAKKMFGTSEAVKRTGVKGKGRLINWAENQRALADSLEVCKFNVRTSLSDPEWMAKFINAVTGSTYTSESIMEAGARIINIERAFNVRQGLIREDDTLPKRFLEEPITSGVSKGEVSNLKPMLDEYYESRGWDLKTGLPYKKTLEDLNLKDIANELAKDKLAL